MSLHIVKSFSRPWPLISAALLIHIGGAAAADSAGDVQKQMSELLAGRITTQSTPSSERHDERAVQPTGDVQELARRLLQGTTSSHVQGTQAMTRSGNAAAPAATLPERLLVHEDVQAMARRLLTGQRSAAAAGS